MLALIMIIPLLIIVIGIVIIYYGFKNMKRYHLILDTPTSKIRSMAMGLVELDAIISRASYIRSPFSYFECVYYYYKIEEYREHTHTDSKGNTHTTYSWDMIKSGQQRIPFFVNDSTGEAYIDPTNAEMTAPLMRVYYQYTRYRGLFSIIISALNDWDTGQTSNMNTNSWQLVPYNPNIHTYRNARVGDRKYYEYLLPPRQRIYIMGTAANDPNAPNNVVVTKGENEPTFMITYKSQESLMKSIKWKALGLLIGGSIICIIGGIIGWFLIGL